MNGLSHPERKIIRTILDDAAARDLLVSVYDGEEWALTASDNMLSVAREIGNTCTTTLRFRKAALGADGKPEVVGSVFLVHGNDCDVISDYSDNPAMSELLMRATLLAEALQ
jgi:hypothetical protein